jgi:hypothetical protein
MGSTSLGAMLGGNCTIGEYVFSEMPLKMFSSALKNDEYNRVAKKYCGTLKKRH